MPQIGFRPSLFQHPSMLMSGNNSASLKKSDLNPEAVFCMRNTVDNYNIEAAVICTYSPENN